PLEGAAPAGCVQPFRRADHPPPSIRPRSAAAPSWLGAQFPAPLEGAAPAGCVQPFRRADHPPPSIRRPASGLSPLPRRRGWARSSPRP
ncbi:hypothetical protein ACFV8W_11475, partial [Streptomyces sp. NPDC059786]